MRTHALVLGPFVMSVAVALGLGAALLGILRSLQRAEALLEAGEGQRMLVRLESALGRDGPPSKAGAEQAFRRLQSDGLRYLRFPAGPGVPAVELGQSAGTSADDEPGIRWVKDRLRLVVAPPGGPRPPQGRRPLGWPLGPPPSKSKRPPPWGKRPPGKHRFGPPPPPPGPFGRKAPRPGVAPAPRGGRRGPPLVVIELVPQRAGELRREGQRTAVIGVVAMLGLVLAGGVVTLLLMRRTREERARSDQRRLALLGRTSALLAHELRNPLASLKGHAQLLEELAPEGPTRNKAEIVVSEARRLERLITELLEFLRSGRLQRRRTPVRSVLKAARARSRAEQVELRVVGELEFPLDPDRVEQLVVNLLDNAHDAAPAASVVEVTARREGRGLQIDVVDEGPGFQGAPEAIFDPLRTGKRDGTGLGLAFVREVAEAHGGYATAARRHPRGARVSVYLEDPGEG